MPETPVHKHDFSESGEDKVRFPRQVPPVKPEPESHGVSQRAHNQLRLRVSAADSRHASAALLRCQDVGHCSLETLFNSRSFCDPGPLLLRIGFICLRRSDFPAIRTGFQ